MVTQILSDNFKMVYDISMRKENGNEKENCHQNKVRGKRA